MTSIYISDIDPVEQEATIREIKNRLPYWAEVIEDAISSRSHEVSQALEEMRETARQL